MRDTIWVVRDPSGNVIGASVKGDFSAVWDIPIHAPDYVKGLIYTIENEAGPTYTYRGYTVAREALAAATRVRVLDRWTIVGSDDFIAMNYTLSKEISDAWVAVVDKHFPDSAPHRVVRVALVDQNHPEMPESSTRVTDEMVDAMSQHVYQYALTTRADIRAGLTAALALESVV